MMAAAEAGATGIAIADGIAVGGTPVAVPSGPLMATMAPMVTVELERVEALELLAMTLAHLNHAEARGEMSPQVPLLMTIRDRIALALQERP